MLSAITRAVLDNNASVIALHRNRLYVEADGKKHMGLGGFVTAIEYCTGHSCRSLGKPDKDIFLRALTNVEASPERVLVVSDDPYSDLEGAKQLGYQTAFTLTGKYGMSELSHLKTPIDHVFGSLSELQQFVLSAT